MELREHQVEAVKRMRNGCILWGGTGSGKTFTSLAYYMEREVPKDIYVITTAHKRDKLDWQREAAVFGIHTSSPVQGRGQLFVDSWHNIAKYTHVKDAFFIFDEQKLVGKGAWAKAFLKISRANRWVVLSATPGDTWLDYATIFIANGFYKNRTEFEREHVVWSYYGNFPQLVRYLGTNKLKRLRDQILIPMEFVRHTRRHKIVETVEYDRDIFKQVMKTRQDPVTGEPFQQVSSLIMALRRVGNGDSSRYSAVKRILQERKKAIIFYNFDYELEILRGLREDLGPETPVGEYNGHRHDPVPSGDSWVYLVQYNGAEAWNCITTDTIIFYSMTYSYKIFEQAMGRIDRMNTEYVDLYYYILMNNGPIDKRIWSAIQDKKDFNESALKKEFKGLN